MKTQICYNLPKLTIFCSVPSSASLVSLSSDHRNERNFYYNVSKCFNSKLLVLSELNWVCIKSLCWRIYEENSSSSNLESVFETVESKTEDCHEDEATF